MKLARLALAILVLLATTALKARELDCSQPLAIALTPAERAAIEAAGLPKGWPALQPSPELAEAMQLSALTELVPRVGYAGEQAFATWKKLPASERASSSLHQFARRAHAAQRCALARAAYELALSTAEAVHGSRAQATVDVIGDLAQFYHAIRERKLAEPLYARMLSASSASPPVRIDLLIVNAGMSDVHYRRGEFALAEPYARGWLAGAPAADRPEAAARLAAVLYGLGKIAEGDQVRGHGPTPAATNPLAALYQRGDGSGVVALARQTLGTAEAAESDLAARLARAPAGAPEAATLAVQHRTAAIEVIDRLLDAANALHSQQLIDDAEPLYRRALATMDQIKLNDATREGAIASDLGQLLRVKSKLDEAFSIQNRAVALLDKALGPNHPDTARAKTELAYIYQLRGEHGEAHVLFEALLAHAETAALRNRARESELLTALAQVCEAQGDASAAIVQHTKLLALWGNAGTRRDAYVVSSLNSLRRLYQKTHQPALAKSVGARLAALPAR